MHKNRRPFANAQRGTVGTVCQVGSPSSLPEPEFRTKSLPLPIPDVERHSSASQLNTMESSEISCSSHPETTQVSKAHTQPLALRNTQVHGSGLRGNSPPQLHSSPSGDLASLDLSDLAGIQVSSSLEFIKFSNRNESLPGATHTSSQSSIEDTHPLTCTYPVLFHKTDLSGLTEDSSIDELFIVHASLDRSSSHSSSSSTDESHGSLDIRAVATDIPTPSRPRRPHSSRRSPPPFSPELLAAATARLERLRKQDDSGFSGWYTHQIIPDSLPPELWLTIFSLLPSSMLVTLQLVSSTWASSCWETVTELDLCTAETHFSLSTWLRYIPKMVRLKRVSIPDKYHTNLILKSLGRLQHIERISVHCDASTTSSGLRTFVSLTKLKSLSVWLSPHVSPTALNLVIPFLPQLESLKVETLRQSFCSAALAHLDQLSSIKSLDLSWCKQLNPRVLEKVALLSSLECLTLDMCGDDVTVSGLACLIQLPKLTELSLRWCENITDSALPVLARFPALRKLDVSFCRLITYNGTAQWLPHVMVTHSAHAPTRRHPLH